MKKTERIIPYSEATKFQKYAISRHHAIVKAKLPTLTEAYKNPSPLKQEIYNNLKGILAKQRLTHIVKGGVYNHNSHTFTYAEFGLDDDSHRSTIYIAPTKAIEVSELGSIYVIYEYDNHDGILQYQRLAIISRTDEP